MLTTSAPDVIDTTMRLTQQMMGGFGMSFLGLVLLGGYSTYRAAPSAVVQPPGSQQAPGQGTAPRNVGVADSAPRVGLRSQVYVEKLHLIVLAVAGIVLPVSFVLPWLIVRSRRRGIASGTWPKLLEQSNSPGPFSPEALSSDTGKLAFLFAAQLGLGSFINTFALFLASVAYLFTRDLVTLAVAIVLLVGVVVRFPTRARVAGWIDRQQELIGGIN